MQTIADPSVKNGQSRHREFCRGAVSIAAEIRVTGSNKNRVQILDLSQTGFRMECLTFMSDCKTIFLTLPSFHQLESRIVWQTEWMYGCQFVRPLHAAVYDHIVRTFPALESGQTTGLDGFLYGATAGRRWGAQ